MFILKNNRLLSVFDDNGIIDNTISQFFGLYYNDTRFFSKWSWCWQEKENILYTGHKDFEHLQQNINNYIHHTQLYEINRTFSVEPNGFNDSLTIYNTCLESISGKLRLEFSTDFADIMELRGLKMFKDVCKKGYMRPNVESILEDNVLKFTAKDQEGFSYTAKIIASKSCKIYGDAIEFDYDLAPKQTITYSIKIECEDDMNVEAVSTLDMNHYRQKCASLYKEFPLKEKTLDYALSSLRALYINTKEAGWIPTAGTPIYAVPFGRDSLITSFFLLSYIPEIASSTLRFWATKLGNKNNDANSEEIGKVPHEIRFGELSRRKLIPFSVYYGSADSTCLLLMLAEAYYKKTGDKETIQSIFPKLEEAIDWVERKLSDNGFIGFKNIGGKGLSIQSWKDSEDSMCYKDGKYAEPPIYVSEVQGYAYASLNSMSYLYKEFGDESKFKIYQKKSEQLKEKINRYFWDDDLGSYAIALDKDFKALNVLNSDAGHLLWCGVATEEQAKSVCKSFMSSNMWSGWGIRCLGKDGIRYNPSSYHNGSIWPHDNIICALGLLRYGLYEDAKKVALTILEVADYYIPYSLPELFSGQDRTEFPPIAYDESCQMCSWSSSSVVASLGIISEIDSNVK